MKPILLIFLIVTAAFGSAAQGKNDDPERPASLVGLTEAVLVDGQPVLRLLSASGDAANVKLIKRDGDDTLVFRVIRYGAGHMTRTKFGTLYVSLKSLVFNPDEKRSAYLNVAKTDVKEAAVATPGIGRVAAMVRFGDEKTMFLLNYDGLMSARVRREELWPSTSFLVRAITNFDKALAEFNALTESARPKILIDEEEPDEEFTVSDRYDRFQDATIVATSKMMLKGGKRSVRVFAEYSTPGKAPKTPEKVILYLYSSGAMPLFREDALGLTFLVDDERVLLDNMKIADEEKTSSTVKQTVRIELPANVFTRIADGKKVEFQIGKLEYRLTDAHLTAFKELLAYRNAEAKQ